MAIFTLQELDEQISAFKEALIALRHCQSYKISGREYVRANLPEIREILASLDLQKSALQYGAGPKFVHGRIVRG